MGRLLVSLTTDRHVQGGDLEASLGQGVGGDLEEVAGAGKGRPQISWGRTELS